MKIKMLGWLPLLTLTLSGFAQDMGNMKGMDMKGMDMKSEPAAASATAKPAGKATAKKGKAKDKKPKKVASAKHEHWVCPMHDGGESDHAGKCPKCGMDLVKEEI